MRGQRGGRSVVVLTFAALLITTSCSSSGTGSSGQSAATNTVSSIGGGFESLSGLALQDVQTLELNLSISSAQVTPQQAQDKYLVALVPTSSSNTTIAINSSASSPVNATSSRLGLSMADPVKPEEPEEIQFHQYLMESSEIFSQSDEFEPFKTSSLAALNKAETVGDTQSFRVLSSMSSISSYKTVTATLRVKTSNLLVYVDNDAANLVVDEDVDTLASEFEDIALPLERDIFGQESDINNDGTMTILMTPILNKMATSGGLVTGFFFPGDLYVQSSGNPASNEREMFFTMVPDPQGSFGPNVSVDFTIHNILPGVLAHEYQHMTSFQQHVFLNGGSPEVSWLNEALSHFAEDITGFGRENPSRVRLALANPQTSPLAPSTAPGLAERGMSYLFIRYLYEQSADGNAFIKRLLNTSKTSISNIETAFAGTQSSFDDFNDFVKNWSMAIALSGSGATDDSRYNYQAREVHPVTGNYTGICLRCNADDGRGTVLSGPTISTPTSFPIQASVESTAIQYFMIEGTTDTVSISAGGNNSVIGSIAKLK